MACLCGQKPCRVLPLNGGAQWFYDATRAMNYGARVTFRAAHADPREATSQRKVPWVWVR